MSNFLSNELASYIQQNPNFLYLFVLQIVLKIGFYSWALYKAGEKKSKPGFAALFACLLLVNDFGIIPIVYLIVTKHKQKKILPEKVTKKTNKKK